MHCPHDVSTNITINELVTVPNVEARASSAASMINLSSSGSVVGSLFCSLSDSPFFNPACSNKYTCLLLQGVHFFPSSSRSAPYILRL